MKARPYRLLPAVLGLFPLLALFAGTAALPATLDGLHFLDPLAGRWEMDGTVQGKPVHYHARGSWVLGRGWLQFSMTDATRPPAYAAQLYLGYDAQAGDYVAHWLDRYGAAGARVVGSGRRQGDTLLLTFPYADGAFRDTLTLAPDGRSGTLLLESQQPDRHWSSFARYRMRRCGGSRE